MIKLEVLLILAVLAVVSHCSSNDVCFNYQVCPTKCPSFGQFPLIAIIIPMQPFKDFRTNMESAVGYINKFPGVIKSDSGLMLHTSLNCTYTSGD